MQMSFEFSKQATAAEKKPVKPGIAAFVKAAKTKLYNINVGKLKKPKGGSTIAQWKERELLKIAEKHSAKLLNPNKLGLENAFLKRHANAACQREAGNSFYFGQPKWFFVAKDGSAAFSVFKFMKGQKDEAGKLAVIEITADDIAADSRAAFNRLN